MSHHLPLDDVLQQLGSGNQGLSPAEAAERLKRDGPNAFPEPPGKSLFGIVLSQLLDPLILVLIFSTTLGLAVGKISDSLAIIAVVVLNAMVGSIQEWQARKSIRSLGQLVPSLARVVRGGEVLEVSAKDLVVGDLMALQPGDQIPADGRIVDVYSLEANESLLTGEALPVAKSLDILELETPLAERHNMVYGGTLVNRGTARVLVTGTGINSEFGRISQLLHKADEVQTPMMQQMAILGKQLSTAIVVLSALLMGVARFRGLSWGDSVLAAVTLAVAAVPEGLPAIVTIALALGVRRMGARNALIRRLAAVETLGSATVICSDKTGTLTTNRMTVVETWVPSLGRCKMPGQQPELEGLMRASVLCNDASLDPEHGDPTEIALLEAARNWGADLEAWRKSSPRTGEVPFDSDLRWMATAHDKVAYFKGAPEEILARCQEVDPQIESALEQMAREGMRVLAVAEVDLDSPLSIESARNLKLLGLQAMIDPPREEAREAIGLCHRAGIRVKMITGDHPVTAQAIAGQLNLPNQKALSGPQLKKMSAEEFSREAQQCYVFARVEPEQKLDLVKALQKTQEVVVMTGDGVNDAPALRQAEIGVAMGKTGTSVSREAADMVLVDDNFATIVNAVREGRRVYDNLVKALAFLLPTNLSLAWIQVAAMTFFPLKGQHPIWPLEPIQILWINLLASVALSLPLAFERSESDIMERPPRRPDAPLMSGQLWVRSFMVSFVMAGSTLLDFMNALEASDSLAQAQSQALTTLILNQCLYLWVCRGLHGLSWLRQPLNLAVPAGILVVLLLHLLLVYNPLFQAAFRTAPVSGANWAQAALVSLLVIPISLLTQLRPTASHSRDAKSEPETV